MSLYNSLFQFDPMAPLCLHMLALDHKSVPRFRDAYLRWQAGEGSDPAIVIYTRTGGGNREDHEEGNNFLRQVVGYLKDEDDKFDSTFASWWYDVPVSYRAGVREWMAENGQCQSGEEKWLAYFKKMESK